MSESAFKFHIKWHAVYRKSRYWPRNMTLWSILYTYVDMLLCKTLGIQTDTPVRNALTIYYVDHLITETDLPNNTNISIHAKTWDTALSLIYTALSLIYATQIQRLYEVDFICLLTDNYNSISPSELMCDMWYSCWLLLMVSDFRKKKKWIGVYEGDRSWRLEAYGTLLMERQNVNSTTICRSPKSQSQSHTSMSLSLVIRHTTTGLINLA